MVGNRNRKNYGKVIELWIGRGHAFGLINNAKKRILEMNQSSCEDKSKLYKAMVR